MRQKTRWQLVILGLFALFVGVLAYPREDQILGLVGIDADMSVRRGLDLQGGVYLVYEADVPEDRDSDEVLEETSSVILRRVNPGGASEAIVQVADNNRIVVQLPDEDDPQAVIDLIGQTARLEFFEVNPGAAEPDGQLVPTDISGEDVRRAEAGFDQFNRPIVNLTFRSGESTQKFADLSTRIFNSGTQILAVLDDQPIFGPAPVQQPILSGESQLSGSQDIAEAQETATLLNAGALPVPIEIAAQQTIGPTLGANATQASVIAGVIGLFSLAVFLLATYRVGGVIATVMIGIYGASMVTIFKLSNTPLFADFTIVLTLAGIAGFIMSIAVAADANILVLERLREERKAGLPAPKAVEEGYRHAWSSIRDALIATLIICVVLYTLASRFGEPAIQGFALVLGIGVLMNVFSVWFITRTLLRGVARTRLAGRL